MEYQQSLGSERVSRWTEAIQRRGGEVELNYCARVTHVLCETQKHGVVMQVQPDVLLWILYMYISRWVYCETAGMAGRLGLRGLQIFRPARPVTL